jgi:hypothetical protein
MTTVRGTGALVALLVALGGYLVLVEHPRASARPPAPAPLLVEPASAVARVELADGERAIAILRRGDAWVDADGRTCDGAADLVDALRMLSPLSVVDGAPAAPDDYGLGAGARHLRLVATDGRPLLALDVGNRNPASTALYVRRDGAPEVLLVGAQLAWELDKLDNATINARNRLTRGRDR